MPEVIGTCAMTKRKRWALLQKAKARGCTMKSSLRSSAETMPAIRKGVGIFKMGHSVCTSS
jgi:hypothetical protein